MLDPRLNLFFSSWHSARKDRDLPNASDISTAKIKSVVSECFVLSRDQDDDFRYRHVGTRYRARYCRDLIGRSFLRPWDGGQKKVIQRALKALSMAPLFGYIKLTGFSDQDQALDLECALLPVNYPGEAHFRVLGLMIDAQRPYWMGINPIVCHQTNFLRLKIPPSAEHMSDDLMALHEPLFEQAFRTDPEIPDSEKARNMRPKLTVIQGGLSS